MSTGPSAPEQNGQPGAGEQDADAAQDLASAQAADVSVATAEVAVAADDVTVATDGQDLAPAGRQASSSVPAVAPKMAVKSTDGSIRVAVELR